MKKIFTLLPIVGLILGAFAIATEIKTTDPLPLGQQLSDVVIHCIKTAVETKETTLLSAATTYQNGYLAALTTKKTAIFAAWDKTTKKEIKTALTIASKVYKDSMKTIKKTLKASKKSANSTYKTDIKACKSNSLQDLTALHDEED